jgi:predicted ABC-type exoprotein transport system permease subunit
VLMYLNLQGPPRSRQVCTKDAGCYNKYVSSYCRVCTKNSVSSYWYICVLILLYMCPHTAIYASSYCYICVLILLYVSSYLNQWTCHQSPSHSRRVCTKECGLLLYICVLILLYVSSYLNRCTCHQMPSHSRRVCTKNAGYSWERASRR